ncbi:hypothetical protein ABNQ38_07705 (plasmid) [Azospirillum sp. A29]|uniref:hypothetical protein n=1 Tax=Azospirillum sp. A29 TaxID=3160606 RepID=UPI00366D5C92
MEHTVEYYMANPGEVPVHINIRGNATRIARAMGLAVDLPKHDGGDRYWAMFDRRNWKSKLEGRITDIWATGDPDWVLLKRFAWGDCCFDLEEGITIETTAAHVIEALDWVRALEKEGVPLHRGKGTALVLVQSGVYGPGLPTDGTLFAGLGLLPGPGGCWWELPR